MLFIKTLLKTDKSPAQFFNRLGMAIALWPHGAQKVLGWWDGKGLEGAIRSFEGQGIAPWLGILVIFFEFMGPIGLILGFLTRFFALGIGVTLITCAFMLHLKHGFFMDWANTKTGEGVEYHVLVLGLILALIVKGGGLYSIDGILTKGKKGRP